MERNYIELEKLIRQQEEALTFEHFSNKDAWEFGQFMVNRAYEQGLEIAISIRRRNGTIIFQHLTEKTNLLNHAWMDRKFKTVNLLERSSFGSWAEYNMKGRTLKSDSLAENEYALYGGGFPVRVKSGEIVAVILTSNQPHEQDHGFIIKSLKEWLEQPEVPEIVF